MESELGIKYKGGGQESQFHSLVFMEAAVVAYNICLALRHSN